MKWTLTTLLLLALCCALPGAGTAAEGTTPAAEGMHQKTEQGSFLLDLELQGGALKGGPNAGDLTVRDAAGNPVEGAEIVVTPWMPMHGHGVWEKPVVKERGAGSYRVENVVIIMGGIWQLKVAVKKGSLEDRGSFVLAASDAAQEQGQEPEARTGYDRTVADYTVPNVTLINQDGRKVSLRSLVESGKPVVVDFIFTTCTTICPVLSAGFANLRKELGADAEKVQLVSITIDPENDRPDKLKRYLKRFNGGPGWEMLTGSREDVAKVLRAFNAFVVDKMSHQPLYLLHAPDGAQWVRINGLIKKSDLVREYRRIAKR